MQYDENAKDWQYAITAEPIANLIILGMKTISSGFVEYRNKRSIKATPTEIAGILKAPHLLISNKNSGNFFISPYTPNALLRCEQRNTTLNTKRNA